MAMQPSIKITKTDSGIILIGACFEGGMKFIPVTNNKDWTICYDSETLRRIDGKWGGFVRLGEYAIEYFNDGDSTTISLSDNRKYAYLQSDSDLWTVDNIKFSADSESGEALVWLVEKVFPIAPLAWKYNW